MQSSLSANSNMDIEGFRFGVGRGGRVGVAMLIGPRENIQCDKFHSGVTQYYMHGDMPTMMGIRYAPYSRGILDFILPPM